jgi:hypothetical protein
MTSEQRQYAEGPIVRENDLSPAIGPLEELVIAPPLRSHLSHVHHVESSASQTEKEWVDVARQHLKKLWDKYPSAPCASPPPLLTDRLAGAKPRWSWDWEPRRPWRLGLARHRAREPEYAVASASVSGHRPPGRGGVGGAPVAPVDEQGGNEDPRADRRDIHEPVEPSDAG